jgi:hypothetical protein
MKTNPLKQGALTENGVGIGTVTQEMVRERAIELAVIDGRSEKNVSVFDLERAKRELTGETDIDPKEAIMEAAPESERWDPVAGSTGHKVGATFNDDEDDEGRSDSERLVEEGVSEAEHDQMVQSAKAEKEEDERERRQ